ncbi:MAG TPA: ABC transporter permease [Candidatus Mediterraneibacter excrementigallinarum]|nr:ABC transporter permease [Candidatus Mediterraneibacter excrementigallinarum]
MKDTKNMLNTLARRSLSAGRIRNLIAVLAIALTAVLFTSVTTIGLGTYESLTLSMQLLKGSKSDGDFRNMTTEQFEALSDADFIREYGLRMPVGFLTNTDRHNIELDVMDETEAELLFCNPSHGSMPQSADEIVTSDLALRNLGAEPKVGETVTIEFTAHGKDYSMDMVVSGWYEATNDQTSTMVAGTAFREANPDLFRYTYQNDREIAGTYWSDIIASGTVGLLDNMKNWSRSVGGDPEDMEAPNYLPGIVNEMTNQSIDPSILAMGTVFVILFIFCGYLLIYNVFDIAVMQDIRRYGLYRTIGMSRNQVKRLINRQALWLSCIGIPLGLIIGFFIGRATLPTVMETFSTEYKNIAVNVTPSPIIFIGAALLAALTVFVSTRKPVRKAANIPPIEAFRYVESDTARRSTRRSAPGASLPRLAWSNLGRSRRRTAFIIVSLMLCVVLLNCVGTAAQSVDVEKQVDYMIRTDYSVVNAVSTNGQKGFTSREEGLSQETMDAIASQPGVTDAGAVYKNTKEDTNVTYDFGIIPTLDPTVEEETGLTSAATEDGFSFNLGEDGRPICNVYGLSETAVARMDLRDGETDPHALYRKMEQKEGLLVGVDVDRSDMSIQKVLDFVDIGDTVTVYKNGEPLLELPVLAKAALNGDDEEIGYTAAGTFKIGGDGIYIYLPSDIYEEIYDEPVVYKYAFNVEESQRDNMTAFLTDYMENTDPTIDFLTADSARESAEATQSMISFVGGLVGIIFGVIGVLNLINTVVTTILTRRHEFATMRSIGMTQKQLTEMMVFEGLFYALGACILGLVFSLILGFTLVKGLVGGIWYFTFHFTILPALITCAVLVITGLIVPALALKFFNKGSIVEQLRISE